MYNYIVCDQDIYDVVIGFFDDDEEEVFEYLPNCYFDSDKKVSVTDRFLKVGLFEDLFPETWAGTNNLWFSTNLAFPFTLFA